MKIVSRRKNVLRRMQLFVAAAVMAVSGLYGLAAQTNTAHAAVDNWVQHEGTDRWGYNAINEVSSTSPTDIWLAANGGNVWHYDGTTWNQHDGTGKWGTSGILSIHAVSPTNVWISEMNFVGYSVWHYDGTDWTKHDGTGKWNSIIFSVSAVSANDVWIAGNGGHVWHYDGTTWTQHSGAGKWGTTLLRNVTARAANDVWISGANGAVWHYNGTTWTQHDGTGKWGASEVGTVIARSTNDVYIAGANGNLWHYDGTTWTQYDSTGKWDGNYILDMSVLSPTNIWISGNTNNLWHYDGTNWTKHDSTGKWNTQPMYGIAAFSSTNVWVAGNNGQVWHGADTPLGFSSPTNKTAMTGSTLPITDLSLAGGDNDALNINLYVADGSLAFGASDGLTFTGASTGNNLQFSGARDDINAALVTLHYTAGNTAGTVKLEALVNEAGGGVIWSSNGHAYKVVTAGGSGITWADAKTAAESQTFGGVQGYLATITSQAEQDFVLTRINQNGWIGANDSAGGEAWRWMTGPESGTTFWTGTYDSGPVATGFSNWSPNEPNNDSNGNNDCAQIRFTQTIHGEWNDLTCSTLLPQYVVEFGAPGNLPQVVQTSFNINVVPHTYSASFDSDGGSIVASITGVEAGQTITLPAPPERAGYIFTGWTLEDDAYQPGGSFTMPDEDVTFVATWEEDGNIDEVPDDDQDNVINLTDPTTSKRVTLEVNESCTVANATMLRASDLAVKDSAYTYDTAFVNFTATGCDDDKTTVNLYYYGTSADDVTVRKHNPNKNSYFTISDALLSKRTIAGQNITVVSYEVTDGGALDIDGLKNGTITDPVGLGRLAVGVPNTGLGGRN